MSEPVTDDEREQIRVLHAQGLGRNEIARQIGRGTRTVSVQAVKLGLTFDNAEMTEVATRVRSADLAEKRAILANSLTDDALRLTEQLWEPAKIYSFGGKDNTYAEEDVAEPPADAKRALMLTAAAAIDRSLKLVPVEADQQGLAAVDQWLRGMMGGGDEAG